MISVHNALVDSFWNKKFEEYRAFILKEYSGQAVNKIENYSQKRLNLDKLIGLFVMVYQENIAGFVSVAHLPGWDKKIARICNRTWVDPLFRSRGLSTKDQVGTNMRTGNKWGISFAYEQQLDVCRKNGVELAIISRENTPHVGGNNAMYSAYEGLIKVKPGWVFPKDRYFLTCADQNCYQCWQKIVYLELNRESHNLLKQVKSLSDSEYIKKFYL